MHKVENIAAKNEFAFFVRETPNKFDPKTGVESSFETWKQGIAKMDICKVVSVSQPMYKDFLKSNKSVYSYIECVQVPENSKFSIDSVNSELAKELDSAKSPQQLENEKLQKQIDELRAELSKKSESETVPENENETEQKKRGRKAKEENDNQ